MPATITKTEVTTPERAQLHNIVAGAIGGIAIKVSKIDSDNSGVVRVHTVTDDLDTYANFTTTLAARERVDAIRTAAADKTADVRVFDETPVAALEAIPPIQSQELVKQLQ